MADYLFESIPKQAYESRLQIPEIPSYITENIKFDLFDWQEKALTNFFSNEILNPSGDNPTHLLFNMATGTGKTLVMASLILHYYQQGYRHFIFFVNQNNIVGKTENNLLDPGHNKYLFKNPIVIDGRDIEIKKVDTFSNITEDIEILFTSIHKLHNSVYQVKENSIFLEDFQKRDIVMLADEAHHLNADTKAKAGQQTNLNLPTELKDNASKKDVEKSWENTVTNLILNKGGKHKNIPNNNVLLEFTATVPQNKEVVEKYKDKIISIFDLKDFLKAGYTKEINLVSSSYNKRLRVLQAILFNWYRYKMGVKFDLPNFKPVILFRSKYVDNTKEENVGADYIFFREIIDNLKPSDFDFLKNIDVVKSRQIYEKGQSRILDIREFIKDEDINFQSIITYLQDAFKDRNCILTHSQDKSASGRRGEDKTTPEQDELLNSLEDKNNKITAVFTCRRLTEGWDVLNLYDIVRMYQGRDETQSKSGKRKAGGATVSEVQLIGRGVRYYPFKYEEKIPNKRKFDKNLSHELRVLEEFYFHSDNDHRYINELKAELKRQELIGDDEKIIKTFNLRENFKDQLFYKQIKLFKNEKVKNPNRRKLSLEEIKAEWEFKETVRENVINETKINFEKDEDDETRFNSVLKDGRLLKPLLNQFAPGVIFKALNSQAKKENSLLRFNNLKEELKIESTSDLLKSEFLGNFEITIAVPGNIAVIDEVPRTEQLRILSRFFEKFIVELKRISKPEIGTEFKTTDFNAYFNKPKEILVVKDEESEQLEQELLQQNWYILDGFYGTSEEKSLVRFLKSAMENFNDKYEECYLLRNEEVYKIHSFEEGKGFMPDFLLFLKSQEKEFYYQVFIEPKGTQFKGDSGGFGDGKEAWKERFLKQITEKYGNTPVLKVENDKYYLIGLPLYNHSSQIPFKRSINNQLGVDL